MVATTTRFASKTMGALVDLLLTRRVAVARCAGALRSETADALSGRDLSDLLDDEDPSGDSDAATALMLVQRAEGRLWEVEEALGRVADGTYGYCIACGDGIPLRRLRALPATASCVECGRRSSHGARNLIDREHLRSVKIRGRSLAGFGVFVVGGER
jgi:RNA polymerase-binding transcription factor DksA